jgi:hypothetical protein
MTKTLIACFSIAFLILGCVSPRLPEPECLSPAAFKARYSKAFPLVVAIDKGKEVMFLILPNKKMIIAEADPEKECAVVIREIEDVTINMPMKIGPRDREA